MAKYILPVSGKDTLGGVKIGDHISVKTDGTISVNLDTIQKELQQTLTSLKEGKALIANAITEMGIETSPDATFQDMADNIKKITTNGSLYNMYLVDEEGK